MQFSRRSLLASTGLGVLALGACSSPNAPSGTGGEASGAEGFPVTVATKFGDVVIEQPPSRVVALGWGDAEVALALGVQPVGASDWLAFGGEGVGPWSAGRYTNPPTLIATLEPDFEAIAALQPDLILDVKSSGDQERYDRLSELAPTVGVPVGGDSYLTSTHQQTTLISQALGKPTEGQALLDKLDSAFTEAAEAHPEWKGRTVSAVTRTAETWGAYIEGSERVQFLERLGFTQNPKIAELPVNEGGFSVTLSTEQLRRIDADLIIAFPIYVETTKISEDPLFTAVPAVADGRAVVMDGDLSQAYSLATVESQLFALDKLIPQLEKAL
ncbi:iron-siderophore ABC transporter substrate-binding protein [Propionibacteriaceae bacterium Y1700]|uniref:iron-siderophore ABC transporter substrate-binding protein n=1 Tax=Microlunatus sp. Y1700 TaxID=3418487 RepID=UPI003DA72136